MSRKIIKTVCRIAKAADTELNFRRKCVAASFGSAGIFLPQAVPAKFNIYDQFSAWIGRDSARKCSRISPASALRRGENLGLFKAEAVSYSTIFNNRDSFIKVLVYKGLLDVFDGN